MSMNLCFSVNGGAGHVDFPFQTPTDLTNAVMTLPTDENRMILIENTMKKWGWDYDERKDIMLRVKALFENPNLTLEVI